MYTAKASNGLDSSTCSAQLIVRESEYQIDILNTFFLPQKNRTHSNVFSLSLSPNFTESEEEKKRLVDQNIPYFAIRLTDIEVMESTFLRFMVKVLGEPQPKIQL